MTDMAPRRVGGFDELMQVGGEERLLAMDLATAGWGLWYAAEAVAVHVPSSARDRDERRRVIRNDLWHAWLRRHWVAAARQTAQTAATAVGNRHARRALIDALRQAPTVLEMRPPLPPERSAR